MFDEQSLNTLAPPPTVRSIAMIQKQVAFTTCGQHHQAINEATTKLCFRSQSERFIHNWFVSGHHEHREQRTYSSSRIFISYLPAALIFVSSMQSTDWNLFEYLESGDEAMYHI